MANKAITWAWLQKVSDSSAKLILLALCDHASPTFTCFPSIRLLCQETELSPSTVIRCLQRLEVSGLISREKKWRHGGGQAVNTYTLNVPQTMSVTMTPMVESMSVKSGGMSVNGDTHKRDSFNPHIEPTKAVDLIGKKPPTGKVFIVEGSEAWKAWEAFWMVKHKKKPPMVNFGWYFPTEWPPERSHSKSGNPH